MFSATDQISVSPQNSYVEMLTPKMMALGAGTFGRWWGHEGGAFMFSISAPMTRACLHLGLVRVQVGCPEEDPHLTVLASWSRDAGFQNCEKYISAVCKPPSQGYFVTAAWADQNIFHLLSLCTAFCMSFIYTSQLDIAPSHLLNVKYWLL